MTTFELRPAAPEDAGRIAFIHQQAWPKDTPDEDLITGALRHPGNRAHLAFLEGQAVGYVDGFSTRSLEGQVRWELDLLAVVPAAQGRGCGRALAMASLQDGRQAGTKVARALIKQKNLASQAALEHAGFTAVPGWYEIWTAACGNALPTDLEPFAIPVRAFNYTGWWLEGEVGPSTFRKAGPHIDNAAGRYLLGALLPVEDAVSIQAAREAKFGLRGTYGWWECQFDTET